MAGYVEIGTAGCKVLILEGVDGLDPLDDNVDVEVVMKDGRRFGGTFFTLGNIQRLLNSGFESGEFCHGRVFWCRDMVIVRSLSRASIVDSVRRLVAAGELEEALVPLDPPSEPA